MHRTKLRCFQLFRHRACRKEQLSNFFKLAFPLPEAESGLGYYH